MEEVIEIEKVNIYEKMQKAKVELQKKDLKKSGLNKFANYTYYELGDFMPAINEICLELKLFTQVNFDKDEAVLTVLNIENPREVLKYMSEMVKAELKGCNTIQALGGVQTYQRRYLYMNAFEISESDYFNTTPDNSENTTEETDDGTQLINETQKNALDEAIKKNNISDELRKKVLSNYNYSDTADIQIKDYANIVNDFRKVTGVGM